jgi:hypothetical protein
MPEIAWGKGLNDLYPSREPEGQKDREREREKER